MKVKKLVLLALLVAMCSASVAVAAENYVRKVDNFFILVDRSGSMDEKYVGTKETKIVLAKALLERMNAMIPELGYQGALSTAAPAGELQALEAYTTAGYGASIAKIPTVIGSNPTPLGVGLAGLEPALQGAVGRSAVIVVSDGRENTGEGSVKVAAALAEKYGACFHTISFADTVNGNQPLLDAITALKQPCGVGASAADLADDAALQKFVKDVFYDDATAVDPCSLDDDGDGVNNCIDKCPDTIKGLAVDAAGCPIDDIVTLKINFDFDKSDIKPEYHQELADFASYMRQQQSFTVVEIAGHTDSVGTDEYNQKLSERRAKAVRDYLVNELGMDTNLFSAVGYGESKPIATNDTDAGRAENRRILAELKGVYKKK
ncbi:OmpA family protein [Desulfomicrobium baculatum]|uniref:OmpA/MotB domain protein n=1 Tax=Desulfomicrobium baculatum (strain DSM 4028 / VKM B-1378 / X) TaxID=525897 RepID=C7LWM2_DESBD|nr:OmpA family protein [Desulfomicrobium baculatum]ACU89905.1 OmpA/MotB domain protein [Desulfomicrobium baculatum DSM 4028]